MGAENENTALFEKINAYLLGELPEDEKRAFEQQIEADPELAREVEVNKAINFSIENKELKDLKDDVVKANELIKDIRKRVNVSYETTDTSSEKRLAGSFMESVDKFLAMLLPSPPAAKLAFAMAIVLVLLVPSYIFFFQVPSPEKLYADNFTPYQNVITSASRSDVQESGELDKVMKLYENKNYTQAITGFNTYLSQHPDQYELKLYRGISNMQLDSVDRAIADLEAVIDNNRRLVDQAQWYLALLYLKDKNVTEATKILESLAENQSVFSEQAQNILNKLN